MAWFLGLPRWAYFAIGGAVLVLGAMLALKLYTDAAVRADRAKAAAEATETARRADEAATGAVDASRNETEARNDEARKAAAESDDPLRAGLDKLREKR